VVCETGWSEKHDALMDDARLWLLYTNGQTRLVIVVAFTEGDTEVLGNVGRGSSARDLGSGGPGVGEGMAEMEGEELGNVGEEHQVGSEESRIEREEFGVEREELGVESQELGVESEESGVESEESGVETEGLGMVNKELGMGGRGEDDIDTSEEQMVIESIDGSTNYEDLVAKLLDLNRQAKLREPLVGNIGATVYLYKADRDQKDIEETFKATLLPRLAHEEEGPTGFGISLRDLLGGCVPPNQDPDDTVWFSFKRLEKFVASSLPETEKYRANARAIKMLKEAGEWEEKETYSQGKRRRLNKELL